MKRYLSRLVTLLFMLTLVPVLPISSDVAYAANTTYYVDSVSGNDTNSGTSQSAPWQSLTKVNATTFQPGDKILFKSGSVWTGQLWPKGSGAPGNPIIIDKYGSAGKPIINGNGLLGGTVYLFNQQYFEINNLEVTNNATTKDTRMGFLIVNQDAGTLSHMYIRNNYVHDVKGGNDTKYNGGIIAWIRGADTTLPPTVQSNWYDFRIENNEIRNVSREGIQMRSEWLNKPDLIFSFRGPLYPSSNVRIANNTLDRIAGDGINPYALTDSVVEYNTISNANNEGRGPHVALWGYVNAPNLVYQFNEVYLTRNTNDGEAFDFDGANDTNTYQYNYSHDNEGGALLVCSTPYSPNNVFRYNISQNDGTGNVRVIRLSEGGNKNMQIYNNTFYVPAGITAQVVEVTTNHIKQSDIHLSNNLFVNYGTGGYGVGNFASSVTYERNLFWGNNSAASDTTKIIADPKLVAPGTGGLGINSVGGYKLLAGSPAIAAGKLMNNNGGRDYWGNLVSSTNLPNIGAYNGPGISTNLLTNVGFETGLSPWTTWNSAGRIALNPHSGNYSAYVGPGEASIDYVIPVTPNTTYTFKGYVMSPNGDAAFLKVKNYGGAVVSSPAVTSNVYTQTSVTFTTGSSNTTAQIYVYHPSGSNKIYGDDFELIQQ